MDSNSEDELLSVGSDSDEDYTSFGQKKKISLSKSVKASSSSSIIKSNSSKNKAPLKRSSSEEYLESSPELGGSDNDNAPIFSSGNGSFSLSAQRVKEDTEITLSDDDDNAVGGSEAFLENIASTSQGQISTNALEVTSSNPAGYGLRRKRKIDYAEIENGPETEGVPKHEKRSIKKEVLDVFSLSCSKITKFTKNPELVDNYSKCQISFMDGTDSSHINLVRTFFEKCGQQFESMFIQIRHSLDNCAFLKKIFTATSSLRRLDYRYENQDDAYELLKLLQSLTDSNIGLQSLTSLKLISVSGSECLKEKHIEILAKLNVHFQSLELGDALWENVKTYSIETFLEKQKTCLETLVINGGFKGNTDKESKLITIPKMEALKTLCVCPKYSFLSEFKNPHSKKARVISLDIFSNDEPFKISVKFDGDLSNLKRLVLGNLIDIEDLLFSSVRKLKEFRCGSYWNLSIRFPSEGSRKNLMESSVTDFQFPDALKDPLFSVKVAKHFPHLTKVWLYLPSVPVLRAFFKAFENSKVAELYLKTQFDFEKTMESCLLPNMSDVLRKSQQTETLLQTLKEYKHFNEYIKYYNVELPVEADDLMEGHSAGIGALKSLKVLHLEHVPRKLLIPNPEDERKWYDHNCKFLNTTFGFESYPLNYKCHKEILNLNLSEYLWKNILVLHN